MRLLILETETTLEIEETLKWGEPAYICKTGSTVRLGYQKSTPLRYAIYFHCKTKLVDTFKELYPELFHFEGNRAIVFQLKDKVQRKALKHCISLSFRYHKIKHLPLLGA